MSDITVTIHPQALVEKGASIKRGTKIWAFSHVLAGAVIGADCNICDHTFVEGNVKIGDRVTIKCGVYLWDGVEIEDDVFIGPCVSFTNDMFPRSKRYPDKYLSTILMKGSSIGANSTILPGLRVGNWAMVGAGSIVSKDVPNHALVFGHPARLQGWVCRCGNKLSLIKNKARCCGRDYHLKGNLLEEIHAD